MTVLQCYEQVLATLMTRRQLIDQAIQIIKLLEATDVFDEEKIRKITNELEEAIAAKQPEKPKRGRPRKTLPQLARSSSRPKD